MIQRGFQPSTVREEEEPASITEEPGNLTILQPDKPTDNLTNIQTDNITDNKVSKKPAKNTDKQPSVETREQRIERALRLLAKAEEGGDGTVIVSLRVPEMLHDYMEQYIDRINANNRMSKRKKYLKQHALRDAFISFYADHPLPDLLTDNLSDNEESL